eukprot:2315024-Pleurochrysis_carterae.AAC.1
MPSPGHRICFLTRRPSRTKGGRCFCSLGPFTAATASRLFSRVTTTLRIQSTMTRTSVAVQDTTSWTTPSTN